MDKPHTLNLPSHCQAKFPVSVALVPNEWAWFVAAIAVQWGQLEVQVDDLISFLLDASSTTVEEKWKRENFKKRKDRLKSLGTTVFADHKSISLQLNLFLGEAARMHVPRNLLLHGRVHAHWDGVDYVIIAMGRHNGKDFELHFRKAELETLAWDIGHICAMIECLNEGDSKNFLLISSRDRSFLRDLIQRNPQSPPKPLLPISQRKSFPA